MKNNFTISDLAFTRKSFGKFVFSVVASGFLLGSGLASSDAFADTFTIGSGTSVNGSTSYPTPFGHYYESARTQYLYSAAELTGEGMTAGTTINQIGFYVTALNGMDPLGDFYISMKNTSTASLTSTFETGLTTVYGPVTETVAAGDWHMMTLDSPFIWDGTSNIVIETCFFIEPYSNNASVQYSTVAGGVTYDRQDDATICGQAAGATTSSNRANVRFEATPGVASANDIGVTNINVVGDPNDINTTTDFEVTIKNFGSSNATGTVALDITNDGSDDLIASTAAPIEPDSSQTVTFSNVTLPGTGGIFTCKATATLTSATDENNVNDTRTQSYEMIAPCTPADLGDTGMEHTKFSSDDPSLPAAFGSSNINSTITISGLSGIINDINVYLDITHVYDGDVEISLESPTGTIIDLSSGNGGSGDDYSCTVFDDDSPAGGAITSGSPPYMNSFSPEQALSGFDGETLNGTWTLHVDDNYPSADDGTLNEWGFYLAYGEPPTVDAEVVSVTVVEPTYDNTPMTINVEVTNNGSDPIEGSVNFDIDNDGTDESTGNSFAGLAGGDTTTVVVTTNAPATAGSYTGKATVVVDGDGNALNDADTDSYSVMHANDVEVTSVTAPDVSVGNTFDIAVNVTNNGSDAANIDVSIDITNDGSSDGTQSISGLASGASQVVNFNGLTSPGTTGSYTASATVTQTDATDTDNGNDTATDTYGVIPGCITTYPYSQDFESTSDFPNATGTTGGNPAPSTGWTNGTGDFNWGYDSGTTTSGSTGPTVDNTLGNSSGRYAYTEASSPNYPSKTAVLYSPCFDISGLTNPSLTFFYHMYGADMGDLIIDIVQDDLTVVSAGVDTTSGQQQAATGDPWLEKTIDLSPYKGTGQIRVCFRGITGADYTSDMAIDDVTVQDLVGGSAPTITHTPISSNSEGNTATITADINDVDGDLTSTGGGAPTLWYRVNGGAFSSVSMTSAPAPSSQGIVDVKRVESKAKAQITSAKKYGNNQVFATFSADIPAQTGNDLVEYYIAAQDESNNVKTAPNGGSGTTPPGSTPPGSFYSYTVTPPPPANDNCADAIEITDWTAQITGNTAQATDDGTKSCGGSDSGDKNIWYTFTIPAGENWNVSFDMNGSGYDTALELFSGACGTLTSIYCNDDWGGGGTWSRIPQNSGVLGVTAGTYYLMVTGYNTNSGSFTIQPTCTQILPPVNNGGAPLGDGSNPVNTNSGTTPVVDLILNGGANNPTSVTVTTSGGTTPGGFQNGVSRTFNIQTTGGTNFTTDLKFYFLASEAATGMIVGGTAKVWRKDGTTWVEVGTGTVVNEGGAPEWWSVTVVGVSSTAPSSDKHIGNINVVNGEFGIANDGDNPLFVELAYLNVTQEKQSAVLTWGTESEVDNLGFEIHRKDSDNSEYTLIASYKSHEELLGAGNSSLPIDYTFVDDKVVIGKTYTYKLVDVDTDQFKTEHETVSLTIDYSKATIIDRFILRQNYPNPFNPETTISFEVPNVTNSISRVEISIFNIKGQVVRNLVNRAYSGGLHSVIWDGKDNSGKSLSSGVYFFKLRTNDTQLSRKMLLLK